MNTINKKITTKIVSGCLLVLSSSMAYSEVMASQSLPSSKTYAGLFGGGGAMTGSHMSQFGTIFFTEAEGGPLAVNAFGCSKSKSTGLLGGHIGVIWPNNRCGCLTPSIEIEGYYMNSIKVEGNTINVTDTDRLVEHDFCVAYPLNTGVFLANIVLESRNLRCSNFKPYVGLGIGSALVSVSDATSIQVNPPEEDINHYSAACDDRTTAMAAQVKVGVHFDFNCYARAFAEYRFIYISQTDYIFGSTEYPTHPASSPWLVKIHPQHYNMGLVGIEFIF